VARRRDAATAPAVSCPAGRSVSGLIASLRRAARVFLAHWRVGFDRALRYLGGVRA